MDQPLPPRLNPTGQEFACIWYRDRPHSIGTNRERGRSPFSTTREASPSRTALRCLAVETARSQYATCRRYPVGEDDPTGCVCLGGHSRSILGLGLITKVGNLPSCWTGASLAGQACSEAIPGSTPRFR